MNLVYDINGIPGWMCSSSSTSCSVLPSNLTWVSNFATALATKFKGQIKYYETGNEVNSAYWTDTCANLVLLHNTLYRAIKAADPNAIVGAPNVANDSPGSACSNSPNPAGHDSSIWLANFLATRDANNQLPTVDTVGVHTYASEYYSGCSGATNPPCYTTATHGCDMTANPLACSAQIPLNFYNDFRAVMNKAGIPSTMPLLVTEGGFGQDSQPYSCPTSTYVNTACLSPTQQVAYVARWLLVSASTWADRGGQLPSWYAYDTDWGTLNGSYGMNPQNASAYGQMESWLQGAIFQQPCHIGNPTTVFVCDYTNAQAQQFEILFNNNNGATATYTTPAWATSYQPLLGTAQNIYSGTVEVVDTPILLTH